MSTLVLIWSHAALLTINAPLILKMRDIIFFLRANYIMGHFKGYFEGAKTFLTREGQFWGQKSRGPLEISPEMVHYVVCPKPKKIISQIFKNSGALVFLCPFATRALNFIILFFYCFIFFIVLIKICGENPAKYPSLAKNPPNYTTAYIVHQSNCRWYCEPTCFSS